MTTLPISPDALSRRSLLRLTLSAGALFAAAPLFGHAMAAETGTLVIGADADPIGLDPVVIRRSPRSISPA